MTSTWCQVTTERLHGFSQRLPPDVLADIQPGLFRQLPDPRPLIIGRFEAAVFTFFVGCQYLF